MAAYSESGSKSSRSLDSVDESSDSSADEATSELALALWARACARADSWPGVPERGFDDDRRPTVEEAIDPAGAFCAAACSCEVKMCEDDPAKGRGVFALRRFEAGGFVALYAGEQLTAREFAARHLGADPLDDDERAELGARSARIDALSEAEGQPMGGSTNRGAYCFNLLPAFDSSLLTGAAKLAAEAHDDEHVHYLDAEDPALSNFSRFVNHAKDADATLDVKVDGPHGLVWFTAKRNIAKGEELSFDYGPDYGW